MAKPKNVDSPWKTIGILAFTQVLSWGSLYYAIAILVPEIQKEMNWRAEIVFGAFSSSLLIGGMFSTHVGIMLDRYGGRPVMGTGSLVCYWLEPDTLHCFLFSFLDGLRDRHGTEPL